MTLRHAAALAFVGWYLMVPPASPDRDALPGRLIADVQTKPLSAWEIERSYDSARDCMAERDARIKLAAKQPAGPVSFSIPLSDSDSKEFNKDEMHMQQMDSQCIETDDPRLKGN
jgi:hypothetical protein